MIQDLLYCPHELKSCGSVETIRMQMRFKPNRHKKHKVNPTVNSDVNDCTEKHHKSVIMI